MKRRLKSQQSRRQILIKRLLELFPGCPEETATAIIENACRSGYRIGRCSWLPPDAQVRGAACAYVRHTDTCYGSLLSSGWDRDAAREAVAAQIEEVFAEWAHPTTAFQRHIAVIKAILGKYARATVPIRAVDPGSRF